MFSRSYACGGLSEQLEAQFLSLGLFFVVDVYLSVLLFPVQALQQKKMTPVYLAVLEAQLVRIKVECFKPSLT